MIGEMRNYVYFYSASLLVIGHLGDLAIDGKIIL
jgi:hypothetical protein